MALGALAPGYLLDTSVIIPVMANEGTATARLAELPPEAILVPAVAIGELYFGAFRSTQPQQALQAVELFAMSANVMPSDLSTARIYGQIKDELRRRGRPIPQNDIWMPPSHVSTIYRWSRGMHISIMSKGLMSCSGEHVWPSIESGRKM